MRGTGVERYNKSTRPNLRREMGTPPLGHGSTPTAQFALVTPEPFFVPAVRYGLNHGNY